MVKQGIFTGGVQIRNLNGYLIAVNGEVFATTNTGGTTNAFFYQAKTNITSGDPGSGHLIWNNATQTSATQLNISHLTDTPIEDIDLFLSAIVSGNKLVVQDRNDSGSYQSWTVSGTPTQIGSSYWTIPVTLLESQGTGTTGFSNNHDLLFAIITGGTGGGGITTNSITFNNSGSGAASGTSFNGGTAVTISYNSIGAQPSSSVLSGLASLTYASGTPFVKMTGAGTFALDTNTYLTANQTITLSGDISGSGTTAITTTIGANKVTNAMLAQIATARIRGRVSAGTGNVEDLTGTQATTLLDTFTTTLKGLAPASGGGTTNFLRADGTWAAPSGGGGTPAGSNRQIQYNNSGAFGADANLSWSTGNNLLVGTATDNGVDKLQVNGSAIATTLKVNTSGQQISISTYYNTGTGYNIWIGNGGANSTSSSLYNVSLGFDALLNNTSGNYSVAIGFASLKNNTTGYSNMGVGAGTLQNNISGFSNVAIGSSALNSANSSNNVGIGDNALVLTTSGNNNIGIGSSVLFWNTTGTSNIAFGYNSGRTTSTGGNNTNPNQSIYIGEDTRPSANGNTNEIVIGHNAIGQGSNTVTLGNSSIIRTFLRGSVMVNTTTDNGVDKLQVNGSAIATTLKVNTSGQQISISTYYVSGTGRNIWIGNGGANSTSSSLYNVSLGFDALLNNTSGNQNVAIGTSALQTNTSGIYNMAIGASALQTNTTGNYNVAVGVSALASAASSRNTSIGSNSLALTTSGSNNVGIGDDTLFFNTTGSSNVAIGSIAGRYISGGGNLTSINQSILIGADTRPLADGDTNEIVIGHNAIGQGSNSVTLGNSSITQTLLRGTVTGGSFVKSGGTNSQVLYADGSTKQITSGTASPTGGNDGDIYLQYV